MSKIIYEGVPDDNLSTLPVNAEFTSVTVPEREGEAWYRVYYRVVLGVTPGARGVERYQDLENEPLTPEEIEVYERLLGEGD